jgi:haloalkane dehalogenase
VVKIIEPAGRVAALPQEVRALYPFFPCNFETGAGIMSYLDEGPRDAPVVLMVHGNPSWSFLYRSLVLKLRGRFRCIVPDHLGCGLSDKPQNYDYYLGAHIGNLGKLLDHLGISRAHLVVHDWGGPIGLGVARRRDGFVDRLTILNTAAFPSARIPKRIAVCRLPWIGALLVRGLNGFSSGAVRMAVRGKLPAAVRLAYLWPHRSWAQRIAVREFVRDIPLGSGHRTQAEIEAIGEFTRTLDSQRCLIVWGAEDWCFDDVFLEEWNRRLPDARSIRLEGVGHWSLEDAPEKITGEIAAFLD